MAFNAASVDKVNDGTARIQALRAMMAQTILKIGDNDDAVLSQDERDAIRTRLMAQIGSIRDQIKTEVATW
jgi:hypothetical protein